MLLKNDQPLFGVHPALMREAARVIDGQFTPLALAEVVGLPESRCEALLQDLVRASWVQEIFDASGTPNGFFQGTREWSRLGAARFGSPVSRSKAEKLVKQLLQDVRQLNRERPPELGLVTRVCVFGSYLDATKQELGDVDLMVDLAVPARRQSTTQRARVEAKTLQSLRRNSPYLSLSLYKDTQHLDTPRQALYLIEEDPALWGDSAREAQSTPAHLEHPALFLNCAQTWLNQASPSAEGMAVLGSPQMQKLLADLAD